MNKVALKNKASDAVKRLGKFKYAAIILFLGIALMVIPVKEKETSAEVEFVPTVEKGDLASQLEEVLSTVEGAGKTKVLLTLDTGTELEFQKDVKSQQTAEGENRESSTVLVSTGSGTEDAVVRKTTYPQYRGAVIVCQGADRASVRLDIVRAVSGLTGLTSDKITVIKMSEN